MSIGSLLKKLCLTCMSGCILLTCGCAINETAEPEDAVSHDAVNLEWNKAVRCLYDFTGDGIPEICFETSLGSGMVTYEVHVYDIVSKRGYGLRDRGGYDYFLSLKDGKPSVLKRKYGWKESDSEERDTYGWMALKQIDGTDEYQLVFDSELEYKENGKAPKKIDWKHTEYISELYWRTCLHDFTGDGVPEICIGDFVYSDDSKEYYHYVDAYDWTTGKLYRWGIRHNNECTYTLTACRDELFVIVTERDTGVYDPNRYPTKSYKLVLNTNDDGGRVLELCEHKTNADDPDAFMVSPYHGYLCDITGDGWLETCIRSGTGYGDEQYLKLFVYGYEAGSRDLVLSTFENIDSWDKYKLDIIDGKLRVIQPNEDGSETEMFKIVMKPNDFGGYTLSLEAVQG